MDDYQLTTVILGSISSQYRIPLRKLRGCRIAVVVEEQVRLIGDRDGWSAKDFPWDKILTDDQKIRPELLQEA